MSLDAIDRKLLKLLQANSKQTNKELSNQLNLSITAVYERIRKLEKEGIISKYVALLHKEMIISSRLLFQTWNLLGNLWSTNYQLLTILAVRIACLSSMR